MKIIKNSIKFLVCVLLSLSFYSESKAQTAGYLGSKISIGYIANQSLFPFNGAPMWREGFGHERTFFTKNIHHITLDYAIAERISIGVEYGYLKNNFDWHDTVFLFEFEEEFVPFIITPYEITNHQIGLNVRFYGKDKIAPVGTYHSLSFFYHFISSSDFLNKLEESQMDELYETKNALDGFQRETNLISFKYSIGKKWPLHKHFALESAVFIGSGLSKYAFKTVRRYQIDSHYFLFRDELLPSYGQSYVSMNSLIGIKLGFCFMM